MLPSLRQVATPSRWCGFVLAAVPFLLLGACSGGNSSPAVAQPELSIVDITPAEGATGVPFRAEVVITFGEAMELSSLMQGAILVRDGAGELSGQVSYLPTPQQLVWTPTEELPRGAALEVVVTTRARSLSGLSLLRDRRSTFTVVDGQFQPPAPLLEEVLGARPFVCVDGHGNVVGAYGDAGLSWQGGSWEQPVALGAGRTVGVAVDRVGNAAVLALYQSGNEFLLEMVRRPPFSPFGAQELVARTGALVAGASLVGNQHGDLAVRWVGSEYGTLAGRDGILRADASAPQAWHDLSLPPAGTFPQRQFCIDGQGNVFTLQRGPARLLLQRHDAATLAVASADLGRPDSLPLGVCADGQGRCVAVWLDFEATTVVVHARRRLADGAFEAEQEVFRAGSVGQAELVGSDRGDAVLALTTPDAGASLLHAVQFLPGSGTWGAAETITAEFLAFPNGAACTLAAAATGEVWILFQRMAATADAELVAARARPQQGLAPPRVVFTAMTGYAFGVPAAAVDAAGRASLLFTMYQPLPAATQFLWGVRFE